MDNQQAQSTLQAFGKPAFHKLGEGNFLAIKDAFDTCEQIMKQCEDEEIRLKAVNSWKDLAKFVVDKLPAPAVASGGGEIDWELLTPEERVILVKALPKAMGKAGNG